MGSWLLTPYSDSLFGSILPSCEYCFFTFEKKATIGPFEEYGVSLGWGKGGGQCHFSVAAALSLKA